VIGAIVVGCDDGHVQGALAAAGLQPRVQGLLDLVYRMVRVELDELDVLHEPLSTPRTRESASPARGMVTVVAGRGATGPPGSKQASGRRGAQGL